MTLELKLKSVEVNFDEVQGFRDLKDTMLPLVEHINATAGVTRRLQAFYSKHFEHEWSLDSYQERLSDYSDSLSVLIGRVNNTIDTVR